MVEILRKITQQAHKDAESIVGNSGVDVMEAYAHALIDERIKTYKIHKLIQTIIGNSEEDLLVVLQRVIDDGGRIAYPIRPEDCEHRWAYSPSGPHNPSVCGECGEEL